MNRGGGCRAEPARWMKYNLCVKRFTEMTALVSIKAAVSWELGLAGAGVAKHDCVVSGPGGGGRGELNF